MDNGIYIALSRQTALFRKMDMVANNIANMDTTGFQTEHMMFTDYLVNDGNQRKMAFTQDIASYRDTETGRVKTTGNPLDVAIMGGGYFAIETPKGTQYSKAGNFHLDSEGTLVNEAGLPVLDDSGQHIEFAPEDREVTIGANGSLLVDGEERGAIGVVKFDNPQKMTQTSGTLLTTDQTPTPDEDSRLVQGAVEQSNAEPVLEMVEMLKTNRSVSNTAKYIEVMYDLQRKANNTYAQGGK